MMMMDKDIEKTVRNCRDRTLAAKSLSIKSNSWSKADTSWFRLHIDFAGPINGSHCLVVVDSFSKKARNFKVQKTNF